MEQLVTAVITTYKRNTEILERALKSVLCQTYDKIEILIIDDNRGENEYSEAIQKLLMNYNDVKRLCTEGGHGAQYARNTGISHANGEFIAFLDDDDEWLPDKIKKQVVALNENPDAGMCFTRGYRVNENFDPPYINDFQGKDFQKEVTYQRLLRGDCIGTTSQAMLRKSALLVCGGFDVAFPARQDYEMWVRISRDYRVIGIDECLFRYHISKGENQITKNWDRCIEGHEALYQKYKIDIDRDRRAKFNVVFYMAYYNRQKGDMKTAVRYYIQSFFVSPAGFWEKGIIKLNKLKETGKRK